MTLADLLSRWRSLQAHVNHRDVLGVNRRNVDMIYPNNPREHFPVADDKLLTKRLLTDLGVPVPNVIAQCDGLYGVKEVVTALEGVGNFVVKPAQGSRGDGLLVVADPIGPREWRRPSGATLTASALTQHIANTVFGAFSKDQADVAIIEERILPHPVHAAMWPTGLCDLRIVTLREAPLQAMLRVPTARSGGRANLHQGGVGVGVDVHTGRTHRAWHDGRPITHHPDSGAALTGVQLPSWDQVQDIVVKTTRLPLKYLGLDLVVDQRGRVLVLEVNARPGLEIQNVVGQGQGAALAASRA